MPIRVVQQFEDPLIMNGSVTHSWVVKEGLAYFGRQV
jgi:hypothetical protein